MRNYELIGRLSYKDGHGDLPFHYKTNIHIGSFGLGDPLGERTHCSVEIVHCNVV